jgi:hypothetical protein
VCSNGGALSQHRGVLGGAQQRAANNSAIGAGANPASAGTPGGGSGGAIYLDGNLFTMRIAGTRIEDNHAIEGGGAVFFVSNDRTGTMRIEARPSAEPQRRLRDARLPGHLLPRRPARRPFTNSTMER